MRKTRNWMTEWDGESHGQLASLAVRAYMKCSRFIEFSNDTPGDKDGVIDLVYEDVLLAEVKPELRADLEKDGMKLRDCKIEVVGDKISISKTRNYAERDMVRLAKYTDEDIYFHARGDEKAFFFIEQFLLSGEEVVEDEPAIESDDEEDYKEQEG